MPKTQDILAGLHTIANNYKVFAIIWHVIFYGLIIALVLNWMPSNRLLGTLLCIPLFSVAIFAWLTGNPFNGTLFSIAVILILIFGLRVSSLAIGVSPLPFLLIGIIMVVFGLVYPHFIETGSVFNYLYASPVGLIPCPTLAILIGFILVFNGFGSLSITLIFIIFGLFYGIFGALRLKVHLDIFLIFGSLAQLIKYFLLLKN